MPNLIARPSERNLSEAEAIAQAKRGDGTAFEYLYQAHCRRVYNVCLRMLRNPAEAEDLTQQAFLQVFRKIGTFRGEAAFATWLHRVTVNLVFMHLRRKKPTELLAEPWNPADTDGCDSRERGAADPSMLGAIDRLNLKRAIRKLPSGYRRFFLLHDVIGYQHHEIAGLLGCSTGCSKSQLHKARKRLRRLLQGEPWRREATAAPA
jgi:RNA polymerase sigma-70 factor, ECF subfamily